MANIDVKHLKIARRYADALIETAKFENNLQGVYDELVVVQDILSSSNDLSDFLINPVINDNDKKDVLEKVFRNSVGNIVYNFLNLLVDNARFDLFECVVIEYLSKLDQINNIIKVDVLSAVELDEHMKSKIIEKLEYKTSKKVIANYDINSEIIAGLVVKVNDKTIDTSLKTKLNAIKRQLI